ncbi:ATP-binding protein [Aestuariibaculum sp. M13]|uniref:ATP-binding protein n=1 Tax=Aestuariibaculum sp. M13 TaxID=2967132 RepID=UPI002159C5DC|nr:ATP-binding protein [Aestuariibaculum sp. M13]MCR8669397.1 ATP-binding protein [Aestuariibaculum sp. M13]
MFIREIVQNSIDATKIQIWKDICSGIYDFIIRPHLKNIYPNIGDDFDVIPNIKFPDDIPQEIYGNYPILLSVDWDENDSNLLTITCKDNGTGISEENLIRMTRKVGESRKLDKAFLDIKDSLPFWLKPTGAFGIGLQSLFILTDSFTIQTKAENETPKEIIFRSAKKQNYCSILDKEPLIKKGTRLILKINKERFAEIFKNSFSFEIIDSYDYYTDNKGSIYLYKMHDYLLSELSNIEFLNINFLEDGLIKTVKQKSTTQDLTLVDSKINIEQTSKIISYETENSLPFIVYESGFIGTEIFFNFISSFESVDLEYRQPHYKNLYYVRDIPVKDNTYGFYKSNYFGLMWNLLSPKSDKILSLSRNKLISKTKNSLNSTLLYDIFPIVITEIKDLFEKNYGKYKMDESSKSCVYFHIIMSCIINDNPNVEIKHNLLNNLKIPTLLIESITNKDEEINAKDFFNLEKLIVVSGNSSGGSKERNFQIKQTVYESLKTDCEKENVDAIVWANQYFDIYLRYNYEISKIYKKNNSGTVYILTKKTLHKIEPVSVDDETRSQILKHLVSNRYALANRQNIYSISPYCNILSVKNVYLGGFEHFPYLSSHSIVSPFKNKRQVDFVIEKLDKVKLIGTKLIEYIKDEIIDILITPKLINHIKENRVFLDEDIDNGKIKSEYAKLIADLYKTIKTQQK